MSKHILKNELLTLQFDETGAELTSIYNNGKNIEYLWNGDPLYWKRHSPILFPFVGSTKNKSYSYQERIYPTMQHGFARDMMFSVLSHSENEIWFLLKSDENTRKIYPFEFSLELGYRLQEGKVTVLWRVINTGNTKMYFSIGGHPAFYCPLYASDKQEDYSIQFDTVKPIRYLLVDENGFVNKRLHTLTTDHGLLPINPRMFDKDALIIENHQCHKVSFLDPARLPYLTVTFDAPLFGIWSPVKKDAPFICIEPWYGRCDASDFSGTLEEREWSNSLEAGEVFEAHYTIETA